MKEEIKPGSIAEFEKIYKDEYCSEIDSCDKMIRWCEAQNDTHGMNFHQGKRSAHIFHDIQMCELLRTLKRETP